MVLIHANLILDTMLVSDGFDKLECGFWFLEKQAWVLKWNLKLVLNKKWI